jgi:hypothetical protein
MRHLAQLLIDDESGATLAGTYMYTGPQIYF